MRRILVGLLAVFGLVAFTFGAEPQTGTIEASSPGTQITSLLSCPNVHGDLDDRVDLFGDILDMAGHFGDDSDDIGANEPDGYHPLYDVVPPFNIVDLFNDILHVAGRFGETCPRVDSEVARATLWGIANLPHTENVSALAAIGYYRATTDVPGQGVHYVKLENWDGVFDPQAPEGLVYNNGKLVAQLYVVNGDVVGWGSPPPNPSGPALHDINIDAFCSPVPPNTLCSWATDEGWHDHHNLCTIDIGTASAIAVPGLSSSSCTGFAGGQPVCTVPISATPCYRWDDLVGWMGHLWNFQLNENWIDEDGDTTPDNGRFADCFPDVEGWKAFNCPS